MYYPNNYNMPVNPIQQQMNRLQQMEQQYGQMQPNQQPIQQQEAVIPVGSIEEVKAYSNYWDGQAKFFIDNNSNTIYKKQLGINGVPTIQAYVLSDVATTEKKVEYTTREEFEEVKKKVEQLLENLGGNV